MNLLSTPFDHQLLLSSSSTAMTTFFFFLLLAGVHLALSEPVPINVNNPGPNDRVDILQMRQDSGQGPGGPMRNALKSNAHNRWTKYRAGRSKYIIPFVISGSYNQNERAIIRKAMHSIDKHTCIRFRERRANEPDYVDIKNQGGQGCYTMVGMVRGHNLVMMESSPGATCIVFPTVVHELMHKIGLWHEQMRYDRDRHIEVLWNNIPQDLHSQFAKVSDSISTVFGVRYDYRSVMHYTKNAFARTPDMVTMRTLNQKYQNIIGTAQRASRGDWTKICAMYKCGRCMGKAFSRNRSNRKRKGHKKTNRNSRKTNNSRKRQRTEPSAVWMASNPQMVVGGANGTAIQQSTSNGTSLTNDDTKGKNNNSSAISSVKNDASSSINEEDDEESRAVSDSDESSSIESDEVTDEEDEENDQAMDDDDDEEKVNDRDEEESEEDEGTMEESEDEANDDVVFDGDDDDHEDDKRGDDDEEVEKMRRRKRIKEEDKDWKENNLVEDEEEEEAGDDEERRKT